MNVEVDLAGSAGMLSGMKDSAPPRRRWHAPLRPNKFSMLRLANSSAGFCDSACIPLRFGLLKDHYKSLGHNLGDSCAVACKFIRGVTTVQAGKVP